VADSVRSILDGHIVLTRDLADQGHFPAIDVLRSISRLRAEVCGREALLAGRAVLGSLATFKRVEDMVNIGAYARGSNPDIDKAIELVPSINAYLRQDIADGQDLASSFAQLQNLAGK
jgi:flagellum-specific ATP synthase